MSPRQGRKHDSLSPKAYPVLFDGPHAWKRLGDENCDPAPLQGLESLPYLTVGAALPSALKHIGPFRHSFGIRCSSQLSNHLSVRLWSSSTEASFPFRSLVQFVLSIRTTCFAHSGSLACVHSLHSSRNFLVHTVLACGDKRKWHAMKRTIYIMILHILDIRYTGSPPHSRRLSSTAGGWGKVENIGRAMRPYDASCVATR